MNHAKPDSQGACRGISTRTTLAIHARKLEGGFFCKISLVHRPLVKWSMAAQNLTPRSARTVRTQQTSLQDTIKKWGLKCYPDPPGNGVHKILKETAKLWHGRYPRDVDPHYNPADPRYNLTVITTSAIGWDDEGQLMFVFLKGNNNREVLSKDAQQKALVGLPNFAWSNCDKSQRGALERANQFNIIDGQPNPVPAEEANGGFGARSTIWDLGATTHPKEYAQNQQALQHVLPLLEEMGNRFAEVLPRTFGHHKHKMRKLGPKFRLIANLPFTTYTFLRSAPAAINVDANAKVTPHTKVSPSAKAAYPEATLAELKVSATPTYALMTSVAPDDSPSYKGGEFCLVQYQLVFRVRPGDLLMAATSAHEHCNLSPVIGMKYSIIVYLKPQLTSPKVMRNYLAKNANVK